MPLIVFEGLDRSGKTTQAAIIASVLREADFNVHEFKFPMRDNTELGRKIKLYLAGEIDISRLDAHLMFYQQRLETKAEIEHLIRIGAIVILDRYSASAIAYGVAGGLPMSYCKDLEVVLPKPDLTIFLDVSIQDVFHRGGFGADRFETIFYHEMVADVYPHLVEPSWVRIDGTMEKPKVYEAVCEAVANMLEKPNVIPVYV